MSVGTMDYTRIMLKQNTVKLIYNSKKVTMYMLWTNKIRIFWNISKNWNSLNFENNQTDAPKEKKS